MKPSRRPAPEPERPAAAGMRPGEVRLWALLDRGDPPCPWCQSPAQRVVVTRTGPSLSCWDDHP